MDTIIVPVTDFIRKFGEYADLLPKLDEIILTREGRHFAVIKASPRERNLRLLESAGVWKNTNLDDDSFWKKTLKRKNKKDIPKIP